MGLFVDWTLASKPVVGSRVRGRVNSCMPFNGSFAGCKETYQGRCAATADEVLVK
jgi:hypothetical protein